MNKKKWISAFVCLSMMASMYPTVGAVDATENTTIPAAEDGKTYSINTQADANDFDATQYYTMSALKVVDTDGKAVEDSTYTIDVSDTAEHDSTA